VWLFLEQSFGQFVEMLKTLATPQISVLTLNPALLRPFGEKWLGDEGGLAQKCPGYCWSSLEVITKDEQLSWLW
jgi:hypothetical protein